MSDKIVMAWSSGKDSAMALHALRKDSRFEVAALLTTITTTYDRVSMHGVRHALLDRQAAATGLPMEKVFITPGASNDDYEKAMGQTLERLKAQGVTGVAFGDIFLEDLRRYREEKLAGAGMSGVFPLWKQPTAELAGRFIADGFKAVLTCVDSRVLDGRFCGRDFDQSLLADLPAGVDPCGENGEFHSFCFAGPVFAAEIPIRKGQVVLRDERYWYCDVEAEDASH